MAPHAGIPFFPPSAAAGLAFEWFFPKLMGVHSLASAGELRVSNHHLDTMHQSIVLVSLVGVPVSDDLLEGLAFSAPGLLLVTSGR